MPTIQHSVLTTTDLHEPKGIDAATDGQYYVSDGAGSGDWVTLHTGWGHYRDNAAEQTFNTTAAKLSIDGAGSATEESYLPLAIRGSDSLWDTTNDKITPIKVGDAYDCRILLPVTTRSTAQYLTLELDIGGTSSPTNVVYSIRIDVNRTAPFTVGANFNIFTLSTFLTNGGQIFLKTDAGSVGITAPGILITRTHSELT